MEKLIKRYSEWVKSRECPLLYSVGTGIFAGSLLSNAISTTISIIAGIPRYTERTGMIIGLLMIIAFGRPKRNENAEIERSGKKE